MLAIDQGCKLLVRSDRFESVQLGQFGSLRMIGGRLWLRRLAGRGPKALWLWAVSAGVLITASAWIPSSFVFVGLLVGGSLSNLLESSVRGSVTDYVCLRFWPAFNLADVALAAGALGIVIELLKTLEATAG
ncbi:signal peptidase II [Mycolicibacterium celeriflavum]|uniref:signal peptidase II n=1 Tax=Mycolicibacterium celeriflavum TaxID=1249101 RepID=UPI0013D0CA55|nr:signal peptidase II [Mycolicibacterium celeriflavum]MCV7240720.1 signal peptidase II [Mycolicibacterium celeriflavum]